MTCGPDLDFAEVLIHERVAQVLTQRHRPQRHHGMPPIARMRASHRLVLDASRLFQPRHKIARQERTIARNACDCINIRRVLRRPVEPGEDARQRARKSWNVVRHHRQMREGEARRIAVGVDHHQLALRREPFERAGKNALPADGRHGLVAAAHAPREAAGKHEAEHAGLNRHASPPCADAWSFPPRRTPDPGQTRCAPPPRARRSACRARGRPASGSPYAPVPHPRR